MPAFELLEEFQITVRVRADAPDAVVRALRRRLRGPVLAARLARPVRDAVTVLRARPWVRVAVSR